MTGAKKKFTTRKEYDASLPNRSLTILNTVRKKLTGALPGIRETIRYNIPAFMMDGRAVLYVGVWKGHIGVYPVPKGPKTFTAAVARYLKGKSSAQFPLDEPLPLTLIVRCARYNLKKNVNNSKKKSA